MKYYMGFLCLLLTALSCNTSSKEINYGEDGCHYCRMTIVDKQHAAQYVTKKGKHYNFDAIECMIHQLEEAESDEIGSRYATTYLNPGKLKPIEELTFIISKSIPSPMGAFLSALENREDAEKLIREKGGEIHTWDELTTKLKKN